MLGKTVMTPALGWVGQQKISAIQAAFGRQQWSADHASCEQNTGKSGIGRDAALFQFWFGQGCEHLEHHPLEQAPIADC